MSKHHEENKERPKDDASQNPEAQSADEVKPDAEKAEEKSPQSESEEAAGEAQAGDKGAEEKPLTDAEKIADLEAKLAEANDQFLRKAADFENFRKRMNQEKQKAIDFANESLLLDLIPVMDDFERAMKAAETAAADGTAAESPEFKAFYEGVCMIEKRLSTQLENKWGLKRFDSAGEPFDPNRHEAIMMEKSPEAKEATVTEDLIKGYLLKDRVVRSAKVKVLMPE